MKHSPEKYESLAHGALEEAFQAETQREEEFWNVRAQVYATLAVAAATAQRG